jgi:hypothetical protein
MVIVRLPGVLEFLRLMAKSSAGFWIPVGIPLLTCALVAGCNKNQPPKSDPSKTQTQADLAGKGPTIGSTSITVRAAPPEQQATPQAQQPVESEQEAKPEVTKKEIGKNVFLEQDGDKRRVLINAVVVQRQVILEQLLCRAMTKEHEAILSADCDARMIHAALLAAGAQPGSPVKFQPKYTAAHGDVIKIYLQYQEKGKTVKVPAQKWVRDAKTGKELKHDWVFAGSFLVPDRFNPDGPQIYGANDGDVICVANFDSALLDLPITSSNNADDLTFEAFTERIPALDTRVLVILEPEPKASKKEP